MVHEANAAIISAQMRAAAIAARGGPRRKKAASVDVMLFCAVPGEAASASQQVSVLSLPAPRVALPVLAWCSERFLLEARAAEDYEDGSATRFLHWAPGTLSDDALRYKAVESLRAAAAEMVGHQMLLEDGSGGSGSERPRTPRPWVLVVNGVGEANAAALADALRDAGVIDSMGATFSPHSRVLVVFNGPPSVVQRALKDSLHAASVCDLGASRVREEASKSRDSAVDMTATSTAGNSSVELRGRAISFVQVRGFYVLAAVICHCFSFGCKSQ